MLLSLFMVSVAEAGAEESLPLGFLEFLGGMVEVEEAGEKKLLDPLDFEGALLPETSAASADGEEPVPADGVPPGSEHTEEVLP